MTVIVADQPPQKSSVWARYDFNDDDGHMTFVDRFTDAAVAGEWPAVVVIEDHRYGTRALQDRIATVAPTQPSIFPTDDADANKASDARAYALRKHFLDANPVMRDAMADPQQKIIRELRLTVANQKAALAAVEKHLVEATKRLRLDAE